MELVTIRAQVFKGFHFFVGITIYLDMRICYHASMTSYFHVLSFIYTHIDFLMTTRNWMFLLSTRGHCQELNTGARYTRARTGYAGSEPLHRKLGKLFANVLTLASLLFFQKYIPLTIFKVTNFLITGLGQDFRASGHEPRLLLICKTCL